VPHAGGVEQRFANARLAGVVQPMRSATWPAGRSGGGWARSPRARRRRALSHRARAPFAARPVHLLPAPLECKACPVAVLSEPAHDDAQRVPDYLCAFN